MRSTRSRLRRWLGARRGEALGSLDGKPSMIVSEQMRLAEIATEVA
jgi:hypothetical protein